MQVWLLQPLVSFPYMAPINYVAQVSHDALQFGFCRSLLASSACLSLHVCSHRWLIDIANAAIFVHLLGGYQACSGSNPEQI